MDNLTLILSESTWLLIPKKPTLLFEKSTGRSSGGVANLYGLWDWVGMAPCMGPMSPVHAYSLWAGLCPEKLVKNKKDFNNSN